MSNALVISAADYDPDGHSVAEELFGVINTGFHSFDQFQDLYDFIGATELRWPGGTLAESRPEVYGLDIPGLFDATDLYRCRRRRESCGVRICAISRRFSAAQPTAGFRGV